MTAFSWALLRYERDDAAARRRMQTALGREAAPRWGPGGTARANWFLMARDTAEWNDYALEADRQTRSIRPQC